MIQSNKHILYVRSKTLFVKSGFTLVELMVSLALFSIILGFASTALIKHFELLSLQEQRVVAIQNCESILAQIRHDRDSLTGSFPANVVGQWPNGWNNSDAGNVSLTNESLTLSYVDANSNPLQMTVTSQWTDTRGRAMTMNLSTVMTD